MVRTFNNIVKRVGFFALIALFLSTFSAIANASITVDGVSGYVTATNANGEVRRLQDGDTLNAGDVINTGSESGVTITLPSGEKIVLSALENYTVNASVETGGFAQRNLTGNAQNTLTGTTAGGVSSPTTPEAGGSPVN